MRVHHQKNAQSAKDYYRFSDYYDSGPQQLKGHWFGRGAAMLGLSGEVEQNHFDRMVDNLHPFENRRLTQRNRADRRAVTDITFSAPKSVSLLWAITQDERILTAVSDASRETITDLEQDALTRVNHARGVLTTEPTKNVVGASWLHTTARPIDGHPDPQLHVHNVLINATRTRQGRWTAVDLSAVVRDSGYYELVFQSHLAGQLEQLGYATERSRHNFEIRGVARSTIDKFSRRTSQIEQLAEETGLSHPSAKDKLGATTRNHKQQALISHEELPAYWRSRLSDDERRSFDAITNTTTPAREKSVSAKEAVDFATEHLFEPESVTRERKLLAAAMKRSIGQVPPDQIHAEVERRPWIRQGEGRDALISTREVLQEEQAMLAFARRGRGALKPLAADHKITRNWLSDEQQQAATGLLQSPDALQILRGVAGAGKTTLMRETIDAIEQAGYSVTVLAPAAKTAHDVLREKEGFDAHTLASFLDSEDAQRQAQGGVIWVDEAGQVDAPSLTKLTRIADRSGARVILSGDEKQHQPVGRGQPLRLLEREAGIIPHQVSTIRRQQGAYRQAVSHLSRGEVKEGFDQLLSLNFVHELDDHQRYRRLARDYTDAVDNNQSTLVIAPTHAERKLATQAIRDELKSRGRIHGDEREFSILKSKRLTQAERRDSLNYQPGDVVEFVTRGRGGFKPGDRLTVAAINEGRVLAHSPNGMIPVPLDSPGSFDIYKPQTAHFAAGDLLRITKNRKPTPGQNEKRLNNGSGAVVEGFTANGQLKLTGGVILDPNWGHVEHGITETSHSSQGRTVDRTFLVQSAMSYPASSPEQAYVSASRSRKRLDIYTDDIEGLRQAISHSRPSLMASDLKQSTRDAAGETEHAIKHAPQLSRLAKQATRLRILAHYTRQSMQRFAQLLAGRQPQYER